MGQEKAFLLHNMILDRYKGCVRRIYRFSPSIVLEHTWQLVKTYIADELKPHDKERISFALYDPYALAHLVKTQHKVVYYMKEHKHNTLFPKLIFIADFAKSLDFTRNSNLLHQLYLRGRHHMISTITATPVFKAITPIARQT